MTARIATPEQIKADWDAGIPLHLIAAKFGYKTTSPISVMAASQGWPKRNACGRNADRDAEILAAHRAGKTHAEIGREFSLSRSSIDRIILAAEAQQAAAAPKVRLAGSREAAERYLAKRGAGA